MIPFFSGRLAPEGATPAAAPKKVLRTKRFTLHFKSRLPTGPGTLGNTR